MKNTRRKHSDSFKTEVVLEALKERKTLAELALEYQLSPEWECSDFCVRQKDRRFRLPDFQKVVQGHT